MGNDEKCFIDEVLVILNCYINLDSVNFKQTVTNVFSLIDEGWLSGDLYFYLEKQLNKKSNLRDINDVLEANHLKTISNLLANYQEKWSLWPRLQISFFELGKRYSTRMISCLGENNAYIKGMYLRKFSNRQVAILKADIDNPRAMYKDTWVEDKRVLKYYFESSKSDFEGKKIKNFPVNKEIIANIENDQQLDILLFTRNAKESDYVFEGKYVAEGYYGRKNNLWVKLINDNENLGELVRDDELLKRELLSIINKTKKVNDTIPIELPNKYDESLTRVVQETIRNTTLQKNFRSNLIYKAKGKCELCGLAFEPILVASHIKPVAAIISDDSLTDTEKIDQFIDVKNGLLLCKQHDALFDQGYITFNKAGKVRYSKKISDILKARLIGDNNGINKKRFNEKYMQYHRDNIFKKQNND